MICPKCGKEFDPTLKPSELCPDCFISFAESGQRCSFDESSSFKRSNGYDRSMGYYCAWEDEEGIGFIQGLLQTLRQSIFEPTHFFKRLPLRGGYKFPFLYALIVSSVAFLGAYLTSTFVDSGAATHRNGMLLIGPRFGSLIFVVLVVILEIFIKPFVLYLCLLALAVKNASFEGAFRISCYSSGPGIFNLAPVFGAWIAGVWEFVVLVIGLREGFSIGTGRAIIAILLPVIITTLFLIVAVILVIGKLF